MTCTVVILGLQCPPAGPGEQRRRRKSPVKRLVRSVWLWLVVAVIGVLFLLQYVASPGGYDEIEAGQMGSYITNGQVKQVTLSSGDDTIKATLKPNVRPQGSEVT